MFLFHIETRATAARAYHICPPTEIKFSFFFLEKCESFCFFFHFYSNMRVQIFFFARVFKRFDSIVESTCHTIQLIIDVAVCGGVAVCLFVCRQYCYITDYFSSSSSAELLCVQTAKKWRKCALHMCVQCCARMWRREDTKIKVIHNWKPRKRKENSNFYFAFASLQLWRSPLWCAIANDTLFRRMKKKYEVFLFRCLQSNGVKVWFCLTFERTRIWSSFHGAVGGDELLFSSKSQPNAMRLMAIVDPACNLQSWQNHLFAIVIRVGGE